MFPANPAERVLKAFQSTASSDGVPPSIAVSSTGDVALAGRYLGSLDFGGGALPVADTDARAYVAKVTRAGDYVGARALPPEANPGVGNLVVAFRADGGVVLGSGLKGAFDFGLGTVEPVGATTAPLLLSFDSGMTLVGSSTFAPQCSTVGVNGGVRGLAFDPAGVLFVTAGNGSMTWVSQITP